MTNSRKTCRAGHRCEPSGPPERAEREALHCQGHHAERELPSIADAMGVAPRTLQRWTDPNDSVQMPPSRRASFDALTRDNPAWLRWKAQELGFILLPAPEVSSLGEAARAIREFGDLVSAAADAYADGTVTPGEASRIAREGTEAIAAIAAMVHDVEVRAGVVRDRRRA